METANYFKNIEDALGKAEGRYFGMGYKQVHYLQKDKQISHEGIRESFEIDYPQNWSTKEAPIVITPHFSTLDSVVLAVKLVTDFLREELSLRESAINRALIAKISVKAGKSLVEDLKNIEASLAFSSEVSEDKKVLFKGKVASFAVELLVDISLVSEEIKPTNAEDYYFSAFEKEDNKVVDVSISPDLSKVAAEVNIHYPKAFSGLESAYLLSRQLPSVLDQIIVTAELTEILHARLDHIPREKSKTLIMRKIEISRTVSQNLEADSAWDKKAQIEVVKTKMLQLGDRILRTTDMASNFGNSIATYSVAQEITESLLKEN